MEEISTEDTDFEFLKSFTLYEEEIIASKYRIQELEAEIDEITRLILPELLPESESENILKKSFPGACKNVCNSGDFLKLKKDNLSAENEFNDVKEESESSSISEKCQKSFQISKSLKSIYSFLQPKRAKILSDSPNKKFKSEKKFSKSVAAMYLKTKIGNDTNSLKNLYSSSNSFDVLNQKLESSNFEQEEFVRSNQISKSNKLVQEDINMSNQTLKSNKFEPGDFKRNSENNLWEAENLTSSLGKIPFDERNADQNKEVIIPSLEEITENISVAQQKIEKELNPKNIFNREAIQDENEVRDNANEVQEEKIKILAKKGVALEIKPIGSIPLPDLSNKKIRELWNLNITSEDEILKITDSNPQPNLNSHKTFEKKVITETKNHNNISFSDVSSCELDDSESNVDFASMDSQTKLLENIEFISQTSTASPLDVETNPFSVSISNSSNSDIEDYESTEGVTSLNFENTDSISQTNAAPLFIAKTNSFSVSISNSSNSEIEDSKSGEGVSSLSFQTIDSISQTNPVPPVIADTNPFSVSISNSENSDINDFESSEGVTSLNFQNIDSISQQKSVLLTSIKQGNPLPSQSKIVTFLPKCLQKNYLKCKGSNKKSKKKVKLKSSNLKSDILHNYATRYAENLSKIAQTPVIPDFEANKTLKNSYKEQNVSDSEEETDTLPDLKDSIFKEFSEFGEDIGGKKKRTVKPVDRHKTTLPDSIPKMVAKNLKALQRVFSYCKLETHIQECIDVLEDYICPDNIRNLIFYILRFLSVVDKNPIIGYMRHQESSLLLVPMDSCIAHIFINIDAHPKMQDTGFLLTALINMRLLILGMDTMIIHGLCAFCRVFTKICKLKNNEKEPIALCCDILKMKHKFAPMLVASIAIVWKEIFEVSYEAPEEVTTFYGAISLAARKWPDRVASAVAKVGLTSKQWETSRLLVEQNISAPFVYPSEDTIKYLIHSIKQKCIKESNKEGIMLINSLLIFASCKAWNWVKEEIVNKYLTPKIRKYSYLATRIDHLTLYCKLYGEICSLNSSFTFKPEKLLLKLFRTGCENTDYKFLRDASAMPLLQLLLSTRKSLPDNLKEWINENESNPRYISITLLQHRYSFRNKMDFTAEDMLCV